jgi:hypothetical protein
LGDPEHTVTAAVSCSVIPDPATLDRMPMNATSATPTAPGVIGTSDAIPTTDIVASAGALGDDAARAEKRELPRGQRAATAVRTACPWLITELFLPVLSRVSKDVFMELAG